MKHYYINLKQREDRKQNTEDLFAKLEITDYQRIEAVDGNLVDYQKVLDNKMKVCERWLDPLEDRLTGEVGCTLSHMAWSKIVTAVNQDHFRRRFNFRQIQHCSNQERLDDFDLVYIQIQYG